MNKGKAFEAKFKENFLNTVPNPSLDRLYDQVSGMLGVKNISDYIAYSYPLHMYIELKSHEGNTFPLKNLTQYDKLVEKVGIKGVRAGVIIWFIDHDRIIYVPISTITKLKNDDKKSVNIRTIEQEGYKILNIPSVKKRVFLDSDYSVLLNLEEGE